MNKYNFTDKMREISGVGGAYEEDCRKMVVAGIEWRDAHPEAKTEFKGYENVFGFIAGNNKDAEDMMDHMNAAIGNEATGAMMQACVSHVLSAASMGWNEYVKKMEALKEKEETGKQ